MTNINEAVASNVARIKDGAIVVKHSNDVVLWSYKHMILNKTVYCVHNVDNTDGSLYWGSYDLDYQTAVQRFNEKGGVI